MSGSHDIDRFSIMYGHTIRLYGIIEQMNLLAQLICSRARAEILRVLFGLRGGEVHLREIQRQTGFAVGTVRQDVEKLVKAGLVTRRKDGNRVYYAANRAHPLADDIRQLVLKTVGLADVLAEALADEGIRCALVFGSVAAGNAGAESDVDLLVVGDIRLRNLSELLAGVGDRLGREINPHVLTPAEFAKRVRAKEHFVSSVIGSKKIFVKGSEHELNAMAE
jgi:predicted nucleotidyltransferase/DNA-binding HxlR family transcriptional regulator